jgi:biopolymer transport protein ExbB/TolQ
MRERADTQPSRQRPPELRHTVSKEASGIERSAQGQIAPPDVDHVRQCGLEKEIDVVRRRRQAQLTLAGFVQKPPATFLLDLVRQRQLDDGAVAAKSIGLGLIGFLIAVLRFIGLSSDSRKVSAQLKRDTASTDNPLGRVLAAYESNRNADTETIELKLSEAALKEMPGLTKGLLLIKVISVVAPLMGLLGTVTGMIKTFQVITLYGAGDPKMMAGGISQALMTTVLGLVVAIPMVLLHTVVSGQSRKVINILQSQSAGLVAEHSEKRG